MPCYTKPYAAMRKQLLSYEKTLSPTPNDLFNTILDTMTSQKNCRCYQIKQCSCAKEIGGCWESWGRC